MAEIGVKWILDPKILKLPANAKAALIDIIVFEEFCGFGVFKNQTNELVGYSRFICEAMATTRTQNGELFQGVVMLFQSGLLEVADNQLIIKINLQNNKKSIRTTEMSQKPPTEPPYFDFPDWGPTLDEVNAKAVDRRAVFDHVEVALQLPGSPPDSMEPGPITERQYLDAMKAALVETPSAHRDAAHAIVTLPGLPPAPPNPPHLSELDDQARSELSAKLVWDIRVRSWLFDPTRWLPSWGPAPDQPGTRCPKSVYDSSDPQ